MVVTAAHELNLEDGKHAIYRMEAERKNKELQQWKEKVRATKQHQQPSSK
jgi:hypothetical protein